MELSASVARYHAPLSRMRTWAPAPPGSTRWRPTRSPGLTPCARAIGPGVTAGEVYAAWQAVVDERLGHSNYRRHHCGYVIGIGFPPSWSGTNVPVGLRAGSDLVLREGMVFHVFSWILGQAATDYGASDTAVVTTHGCELLTSTTREPSIVRGASPTPIWTGGW